MIHLRRLFLHDMGRKLLALGLACLTWWLVNAQITEKEPEVFSIAVAASQVPASLGSLTILEPEGWVLISPKPGSKVPIVFQGERGRLGRMRASGIGALFDPEPALLRLSNRNPELLTQPVQVPLREIEWNIPDAAELVLEDATDEILLTFEREQSIEVDLEPAMLGLVGQVNANFELRREQASIEPNRVTLSGPASRIEELRLRLAAWQSSDQKQPVPFFLDQLSIEGATGHLSKTVRLSPSCSSDIRMDPEGVIATLPVVERLPDPVEFDMPDPVLVNAGAEGTQGWELAGDPLGLWQLSFDPLPHFRPPSDVDQDWIRENLLFFVDLAPLAKVDRTEHDLPLRWAYVGEDRPEEMNDSLRIVPSVPANATVKMKRTQG